MTIWLSILYLFGHYVCGWKILVDIGVDLKETVREIEISMREKNLVRGVAIQKYLRYDSCEYIFDSYLELLYVNRAFEAGMCLTIFVSILSEIS